MTAVSFLSLHNAQSSKMHLYCLSRCQSLVMRHRSLAMLSSQTHPDFDYTLITNLMHWLLFIHKILFSSTCFEPQVLILRRIQLYTCSIRYCHSLWEFLVASRYTAWVLYESSWWLVGTQLEWGLTQTVYLQATRNSHREWQYHMLHVYNFILLKMSTWGSKHLVEINTSILWINNNQCTKVGN
jgi:hypothetical protein